MTPSIAYLERTIDVVISGFGTEFTAPTVDFGDPAISGDVTVASGTGLLVKVTVDADATLGLHDITVTEGGVDFAYTAAFEIRSPLELSPSPMIGTEAQGSVLIGRADQKDVTTPFDTLGGQVLTYVDGSGTGILQGLEPFALEAIYFIDVMAPAGATDVVVESGFPTTTPSRAQGGVDVAARTAEMVTIGTDFNGTISGAFESELLQVDLNGSMLTDIVITSTDPDAFPAFLILPASGDFDEFIAYSDRYATTTPAGGDTVYLVVWDSGGDSYDFTVETNEVVTDEVEPNDACAMAQTIPALPGNLQNLALSSFVDEDWFKVTVAAGDEGRAIHVVTSAGDPNTDTVVEVFQSDCTTPVGPASNDFDFHEDHFSAPTPAAGDYFIRITNSFFGYSGAVYDLDVELGPVIATENDPNDTAALALVNNNNAVNDTQLSGTGSINPASDIDFWAVTFSADSDIDAVTAGAGTFNCTAFDVNVADTNLRLFDTTGLTVLDSNDDISGSNWCSNVSDTGLAAGTYYIEVDQSSFSPSDIFDYELTITVTTL